MRKVYSLFPGKSGILLRWMPSKLGMQFVVCSVLFFLFTTCYAEPISSTELISNAKQYDGRTVVYEGEVIADIMVRGRFAWINVKDNKNAIGVWIDKDLVKDITYTGSYKSKGDWIEITGVFHRACEQHGGDLDIHAQKIRKIRVGEEVSTGLDPYKRNLVFILLGILCLVLILRQLKIK